MKVGTDGVLLGCWAPTSSLPLGQLPITILDVGTGSGLIAMMLAQRCPGAQIEAIDLDSNAVEQAKENFKNSAFSPQLSAFRSSLQNWQMVNGKCPNGTLYDLIVSNPPYFQNSLKNPDKGRELARHTDSLSYEELLAHSARLLADKGQIAIILPAEAEKEVLQTAEHHSLYCTHITRVYSNESKPARRVLMAFERVQKTDRFADRTQTDSLILEDEKGGRSRQYQELCKEFYL